MGIAELARKLVSNASRTEPHPAQAFWKSDLAAAVPRERRPLDSTNHATLRSVLEGVENNQDSHPKQNDTSDCGIGAMQVEQVPTGRIFCSPCNPRINDA